MWNRVPIRSILVKLRCKCGFLFVSFPFIVFVFLCRHAGLEVESAEELVNILVEHLEEIKNGK